MPEDRWRCVFGCLTSWDCANDVPVGNGRAELAALRVVANIAEQTAHGVGGLELRRGMRHLPPSDTGCCRAPATT